MRGSRPRWKTLRSSEPGRESPIRRSSERRRRPQARLLAVVADDLSTYVLFSSLSSLSFSIMYLRIVFLFESSRLRRTCTSIRPEA